MPTGQICSMRLSAPGRGAFLGAVGMSHGRFRGEIRQTTEGNGESGPHVSGEKRLRFVSPWHFCAFGSGRALLPGVQERKPGTYPAVNNAYLEEIARQSNLRISIRMNAAIAYTVMFAELFSSVERLTGPDAAALLQNMAGHYDFHDVRVFTPDGNGRDLEGSVRVEPGERGSRTCCAGNHDVRFIRNAHGPDNLLFYSPVIRGGEIVGRGSRRV